MQAVQVSLAVDLVGRAACQRMIIDAPASRDGRPFTVRVSVRGKMSKLNRLVERLVSTEHLQKLSYVESPCRTEQLQDLFVEAWRSSARCCLFRSELLREFQPEEAVDALECLLSVGVD